LTGIAPHQSRGAKSYRGRAGGLAWRSAAQARRDQSPGAPARIVSLWSLFFPGAASLVCPAPV